MEQLRFMSRIERPTGFQFEQYDPIDHEIGIIGADGLPMEPDWDRNLPLEIDAALFEGQSHCLFVYFFQKAKTEFVVNLVKDANDLFGQFGIFVSAFICVHLRRSHWLRYPQTTRQNGHPYIHAIMDLLLNHRLRA